MLFWLDGVGVGIFNPSKYFYAGSLDFETLATAK